ncbi:unnamed protein product, partial [Rotaria magnacalcarata]
CTGSCDNATVTRQVWCSTSMCNQYERPPSTRRCILSDCTNGSLYKKLTTTSTTQTMNSTVKITKAQSNSTISPIRTSKSVSTPSKIFLTTKLFKTTMQSPNTSSTTKTSTTIQKKISAKIPTTMSTPTKQIITITKATEKAVLTTKQTTTAITKKKTAKKTREANIQ